jgi:hypothetical protein
VVCVTARVVGADAQVLTGVEVRCETAGDETGRTSFGTFDLGPGQYTFSANGLRACGTAALTLDGSEGERSVELRLEGARAIRGRMVYASEERIPWSSLALFAYDPGWSEQQDAWQRVLALEVEGRAEEAAALRRADDVRVDSEGLPLVDLTRVQTFIRDDGEFAFAIPRDWEFVGVAVGAEQGSCFGGCRDLSVQLGWVCHRDVSARVEIHVDPALWGGVRVEVPEHVGEYDLDLALVSADEEPSRPWQPNARSWSTWAQAHAGELALFPVPTGRWRGTFKQGHALDEKTLGAPHDIHVDGLTWPVLTPMPRGH